jgi:hypothetical protein
MFLLPLLGGILVAAGLIGLTYCIREGFRIRRSGDAPEAMRARLQRLVAINLASVGLAALGLGLIVAGLTLS